MAEQTKTTLKTYFNVGDTPTEANFGDLIDSLAHIGNALGIGDGDAPIWRYTGGATPPADAATLQAEAAVATAVAVGHVCITANGDIYKCTDASNQAALVWEEIGGARLGTAAFDDSEVGTIASNSVTPGTLPKRSATGGIKALGTSVMGEPAIDAKATSNNTAVNAQSETGTGLTARSVSGSYHAKFWTQSGIRRTDGVLEFIGGSAAANRNAQLTELFASIPTVAGASGTLWNDGGTIKIVP